MKKKSHKCSKMSGDIHGHNKEYNIKNLDNEWYLEIHSFADKEMVKDGEADKEGEEIWNCMFRIEFCPFCGTSLKEKEPASKAV